MIEDLKKTPGMSEVSAKFEPEAEAAVSVTLPATAGESFQVTVVSTQDSVTRFTL